MLSWASLLELRIGMCLFLELEPMIMEGSTPVNTNWSYS